MGRKVVYFKKLTALVAVSAVLLVMAGCGSKSVMDAYVLKDGYLAGDSTKGIKPIRNIIIWPIVNNSSGAKAKGIETKMTDLFVDKFYLEGDFDSVIIIDPDRAKELLVRAQEELGLKRRPNDVNTGLMAAKVGELVGGEALFYGIITDYDEEKMDKMTDSIAGGNFYLIDARENAYPELDSFTPVKYIWRNNIKQISSDTIVAGRMSIDANGRKMVDIVTTRLISDITAGQKEEMKEVDRKVNALKQKANENIRNEEFDKAIAVWNEILKIDPGNKEGKARIDDINRQKKEAQEREKAAALKKEIDALKKEAKDFEKAAELEKAITKWEAVLEKDKVNAEAPKAIEKLKSRIAEEKERAKQQEISKLLYMAQKKFDEGDFKASIESAKQVIELEADNEKAKAIISDSEAKIEAAKVEEEKSEDVEVKPQEESKGEQVAPAPLPVEPKIEEKAAETPAVKEVKPKEGAGASAIRAKAMDYFDNEEYDKSLEEWKKLLEIAPDDPQALEMIDTTEMLIKALQ